VLYPMDVAGEKRVKAAKAQAASAAPHGRSRSVSSADAPFDSNPLAGCADVKHFRAPFWMLTACCVVVYACVIPFNNVASSLLMERDYFKPQPDGRCDLVVPDQCQSADNPPNGYCEVGSAQTLNEPASALGLEWSVGGWWVPPLPSFIDESDVVCTDDAWKAESGLQCAHTYCSAEKDGEQLVSSLMSIPYFMSMCISPFLGGAVDAAGGRAYVCLASGLMLVLVHALLGYSAVTAYVPMVGQGAAYSMFAAALWPSVPYLVPVKSVGIAYGVVSQLLRA